MIKVFIKMIGYNRDLWNLKNNPCNSVYDTCNSNILMIHESSMWFESIVVSSCEVVVDITKCQ